MLYLANDKYNATLSSGYTVGQNVLYVSAVPDNVPTIVVAAKGTANETVFTCSGKTSNSLTGVARLRGANTNLDATTPVTCLNNAEFINQYQTAVSTPETLKNLVYAEDGGSTDAYVVSLDPAPTSYVAGLEVKFKANTVNTGAATLNVNSLGAKTIKKNFNEDLADGDIRAGQIVTAVYDGTNFQLQASSGTMIDGGTYVKPSTNGDEIRAYHTDGTNYAEVQHDGTDAKISTNTGHIVLTPGTSKLVKISVLRQDDTTNTYKNNSIILGGWGYCLQSSGTSNVTSKTVTFGITFAAAPIVVASPVGIKYTTAPTAIGDLSTQVVGDSLIVGFSADSVTTTTFRMSGKANGNAGVDTYRGFSWIAMGEL